MSDCGSEFCRWSDNDPDQCRCPQCDPDRLRDEQQAREAEGR